MPINPHTDEIAATVWADQFGAEVRERAQGFFEKTLHRYGLCTDMFSDNVVSLLDGALEAGMTAMAVLLEEHDRIKGVQD